MPYTTCQMGVTCHQIHGKIAFPIDRYGPPTITLIKWKTKVTARNIHNIQGITNNSTRPLKEIETKLL